MSRKWKILILTGVSLAIVVCATSASLDSGASPESPFRTPTQTRTERKPRNLSLQPEAFKLSRRLGARFAPTARGSSITTGTLTVGTNREMVTITRRQADTGESVDVVLGSRTLTWRDVEGVKGLPSSPTATERLLAERLIFDSPDQFVLAQLRGASYFTIARNVRPSEAGDDYQGPLWTLVRVDEPRQSENARPLSSWRLFYVNSQTGLPDRIEYQLNGNDIRTDFAEWIEQNGEKTPSRVRWSSGGRVIMEYQATSASHNQ